MHLFVETLFEEMNLIGEGSHSRLPRKGESPILETHRTRPSITMIRGQNSSEISQRTWEICNSGFAIEIDNSNDH
jgi:hypothetical protein